MRAGVTLSKIVLAIVSGTILMFGAYLITIEIMHRSTLAEAYRRVYSQVESGGETVNPNELRLYIARLRAEAGKAVSPSNGEIEAVREFARNIYRANLVSEGQRSAVERCAGNLNANEAATCADTMETTLKASNGAAFSLDKVRAMTEFTKSVDDTHKSFHAFWLQVAQLILLNLLLPLLTGLFGYIFGTTQARSQENEVSV